GGFSSGQGGANTFVQQKDEMEYICTDCGAHTQIKAGEPIRCRECGHRIMYKKRTKR
ncbi:hypothetical protein FISHEDRAFT_5263, partial [Fistulina hepatica ATCC 64428]